MALNKAALAAGREFLTELGKQPEVKQFSSEQTGPPERVLLGIERINEEFLAILPETLTIDQAETLLQLWCVYGRPVYRPGCDPVEGLNG